MERFESLTPRGRRLRLRPLARAAATMYGVDPVRMALAGESFNTMFRLRTADGGDFALRVGAGLRLHPPGSEQVEASWLGALSGQTGVLVAPVVRTAGGQVTVDAGAPGVPGTRTCMLFGWVPGHTLRRRIDRVLAARSGRLLAELHAHADRWPAYRPATLWVPTANRVLYWEDPPALDRLSTRYGSLFTDAAERAQAAIDALWSARPHRPHLLHGDLTPDNIVSTRRGLVPIDFQDLVWGFEAQDIAISLLPFQRHPEGTTLADSFRSGYERARPWPEMSPDTLEALFAARRLLMVNLTLNRQGLDPQGRFDHQAERVAAWMGTRQTRA